MKQPIIFAVDDDAQVLKALVRDLRNQYRQEYKILHTTSADEALASLRELRNKGEVISLFISDQRMPDMLGVDFLEKARAVYPEAKRVLLTAYSDTEAAIKAINEVGLHYYLLKPWDPPEEKLYPVISDLLTDWDANYIPDYEGIKVIGYQWSPKSHELKDFLSGNLFPYKWLDIESDEKAAELVRLNVIDPKDLPAVFFEDGSFLTNAGLAPIAEKLGLKVRALNNLYDVVIIGAGPAGLAAAVYGASEGLRTLLIERRAPGGQAGTSSRIENYLGFPTGLSGADLTRRAITQATRFGTEFLSPQEVVDIKIKDKYKILTLSDGTEINALSLVITTGVDYRQLETPGIAEFTGAGIYYGAAMTEAQACKNKQVYVVGGGNSAGQAAMYLAQFADRVHIIIRREDLSATMSQYLIDQIKGTANIVMVPCSEIIQANGNSRLEELVLKQVTDGAEQTVKADSLFIFIGAKPYTDWIKVNIIKNAKGFITTGRDLLQHEQYRKFWKLEREPFLLETCSPGIFAAGDVRAGAMSRVASAVGEGAMAIKFVHEYLAEN
ncbi:fused response regulator/thioredoxin-disulfide reductase [Adhaeribacter aerolatus]|uniref:Fused response regulator/thioredoxin-disulfide reductase n=1 Tax=Adhaeribacter aerolatus TaxID=670289 RepID=A0A512B1T7_9BACT|nr:FAD-dependent oxidoreductase [Adhaeribacter aerolatus]GEO05921.1 fused response regulator/thioredoxin-disulfide reductase [Adhaeribacter aerolatus]